MKELKSCPFCGSDEVHSFSVEDGKCEILIEFHRLKVFEGYAYMDDYGAFGD